MAMMLGIAEDYERLAEERAAADGEQWHDWSCDSDPLSRPLRRWKGVGGAVQVG
jgi:hypothetical protein